MALSKNRIKQLRKLHTKKHRDATGHFIVERLKAIEIFLQAGYRPVEFYVLEGVHPPGEIPYETVTKGELKQISALKSPYDALAVFKKPAWQPDFERSFLYLDHINDPGNLGTIIRTADWFGMRQVVCSPGSADVFNPKAVQATMGALANVKVFYMQPDDFFNQVKHPVWAADMRGQNVFTLHWPEEFVLVMGNEANGISASLKKYIQRRITIPHAADKRTESLNVAISASVIMAQWFAHR